ncbi:DUF3611 family protein [Fischerella thermalis]|uniref:DUF3611 family protein n=1 Tax=Fischerella thermalis TaxID=372787 RepID=UPI000C803952|nr:DUF3611 family protein [Fischerella thermalis]PLZ88084.1 hypothetical protein CI593_14895 [Fischerella thermalis CCMEE 5194]
MHTSHSPSTNVRRIASKFRILGWIGFWLQLVLGSIPLYTPLPGAAITTSNLPIAPLQIISMQAVSCAIAAELVGVIVALWLLYRLIPQPGE